MHETQNKNADSKNRSKRNTKDKGVYKKGTKRNTARNSSNQSETKPTDFRGIKSNDINWWNKSPLFNDVVRIPFNRIHGAPIRVSEICPGMGVQVVPAGANVTANPGVMRINYVPVLGYADNVNSPLNRCMTSLYAANYARTTGAMQFTQADMALVTMASDSIVTNIGLVKRVLGLSHLFNGQNLYMPKAIISACGVDPDTVLGHQDEIRRELNTHIQSLNTLRLPGYLDIFKRHYQLATNVYADEDDVRAQFYTFVPDGYYMYTDAGLNPSVDELSHLQFIPFSWSNTTLRMMDVNELLRIIGLQLSAIRHSSAFALVSGSMQRAFPDADLLQIDICGLDELCVPVPDRNMMWQINNATLVNMPTVESLHVTQDPVEDIIRFTPYVKYGVNEFLGGPAAADRKLHILNSFNGDTSDEFIMEATRLMIQSTTESFDEDNLITYFSTIGTEITTNASVYTIELNDNEYELNMTAFSSVVNCNHYTLNPAGMVNLVAIISRFKNHPRIEVTDGTYVSLPVGDLYRWTTVDSLSLDGLHQAALQSIYLTNVLPSGLQ